MNLKMIVAAVALVAAGSANAALTNANGSTGSALFIEAWDTVSGVGFVQDLGQTFQSGLTLGSLSVNLDSASFASLLGTDTTGAALNWHVFASADFDQTYSGYGILTTVSTTPGAGFRIDAGQLQSLQIAEASHLALINATLGTASFKNIASSDSAFGGNNGGAYYGNFIGGNSAKTGFGALDFYSYTNDPDTFALVETKLNGAAGGDHQFKLASNGTLTFNAATASAVPLPAAAWLFGSGLLGLVGIGRRRNKQA
jgi:hypothetical protein